MSALVIPSQNYSTRRGKTPRLLIFHTAEGATDAGILARWFAYSTTQVSSHVTIDETNTVRCVPDEYAAWTARAANSVSIQAELCAFARWDRDEWARHPGMLEQAAAWAADTATRWSIPLVRLVDEQSFTGSGVCQHVDITRGWHVGTHTDCGAAFPLDDVIRRAVELTGKPAPAQPAKTPTQAPVKAPVPAREQLVVDGALGPMTISALQRAIGTTADGVLGVHSRSALQRHLGVRVDGVVGPVTVRALQRRVGVRQDGAWGPDTTRALQRVLNEARF